MTWRVGNRVPLNVYLNDKPMFQCHTPEDAAMVVALLNGALPPRAVELLEKLLVAVEKWTEDHADHCRCTKCSPVSEAQAFLDEIRSKP